MVPICRLNVDLITSLIMLRKLWHKNIKALVKGVETYLNSLLKLPETKKAIFQSRPALLQVFDTSSNKCPIK